MGAGSKMNNSMLPEGFISWCPFCKKFGKSEVKNNKVRQKLLASGDGIEFNGAFIVKETAEWPKRNLGWKASAKLARERGF